MPIIRAITRNILRSPTGDSGGIRASAKAIWEANANGKKDSKGVASGTAAWMANAAGQVIIRAQASGTAAWTANATAEGGAQFLLDTLTASAAAAYSLRKINSAYTGNCLIVRRDSDDTTQAIGFDGAGFLDTAAMETFVGAGNNGFIDTWYDQSGNGNDHTQSTNTNQPQIVASGSTLTASGNSKAAIRADGTNDYLTAGTNIVNAPSAISAHIVSAPVNAVSSGTSDHGIYALAASVSERMFAMYGSFFTSETHNLTFSSGSTSNLDNTGAISAGEVDYWSHCIKNNDHRAWKSGTSVEVDTTTSMDPTQITTSAELRLFQRYGTSFTTNGNVYLQEFILLPAHTEDNGDRTLIENSQSTFWS